MVCELSLTLLKNYSRKILTDESVVTKYMVYKETDASITNVLVESHKW